MEGTTTVPPPQPVDHLDLGTTLRMTPAIRRIFCCSVTAASGFFAAYVLVAYAISLIYELVWVIEADAGLPVASVLLMLCYGAVVVATVALLHGLIAKQNKCLLVWLCVVILVLVPECALVFYMSIVHWGLQGVYGGAELACYVARLPGIVCGVVLVQSAYAMREMRNRQLMKGGDGGIAAITSEFDASHYVPEPGHGFTNAAFLEDSGKPLGSMMELRRHVSAQNLSYPYPMLPQPPPGYWQHLAERQYAASLRGIPRYGHYGTLVAPRHPYDKRRHSVVGAFYDEYEMEPEVGYQPRCSDTKSEMAYPRYYGVERLPPYGVEYDPRFYPREKSLEERYDPRFYPREKSLDERYDQYPNKRPPEHYGVNLLREPPYEYRDPHYYGGAGFRSSHNSVGRESDDMAKYKDVAL